MVRSAEREALPFGMRYRRPKALRRGIITPALIEQAARCDSGLRPWSSASLIRRLFDQDETSRPGSGSCRSTHYLNLIKSVRLSVEALGFKGSFVAFALF
jgi:hypothetical protein